MRAKQFTRKVFEAMGDGDVANAVVAEVIKLIGEGHTEVSPDVITTKVSAALGRPFMLKDLVAANNSSPELQHYIDSINPSKIKFSTDILTVKNQDPVKTKEKAQSGVANMASRAASRPRLGEGIDDAAKDADYNTGHKKGRADARAGKSNNSKECISAQERKGYKDGYKSLTEGWNTGSNRVSLPDSPHTYWSGTGPLQKEYDALYNELVPSQGKADTIEGEVLRASSKIVYRHYNDGDEFNEASFDQLTPYIGTVTGYDDLAHKAIEFAVKANGNYTPNPDWDSLDVMDYGPAEEEYDDEDEEDDWYDEEEVDEGLAEEYDEDEDDDYEDEDQGFFVALGNEDNGGFVGIVTNDGGKVAEGWESGPEERTTRERDPDAEYDARRQEKIDAEADKAQAKRPQTKVYSLSGRGPNQEPNYAFSGEYDSQDAADAARKKLMADPKTPNPRDIGIRSRTKYTEDSVTPLRDLEDYQAKKKALQDIQTDPDTSKDPELSLAVMRRLAGLEKQRSELK